MTSFPSIFKFCQDPSYYYKVLRRSSNIEALPNVENRNESKVLVLFTGGTIGMKKDGNRVYKPISNMLEDALRNFPTLNDKEYVKKNFPDQNPPPLVLPATDEPKRVVYTIYEYDPLLDSSNMTINDWIRVATDIKNFYHEADGFVVLHGTDTMAYTASALSFMLENLGKPVILTGSQIPIFEPRSDGQNNFLSALILAGNYPIPEVTLFFNHKLYRGNSTTKINSQEFDAFDSPNSLPLAKVGIKIHVDWKSLHRSPHIEKFNVQTTLNRNVALLRIFPSITTETVRAFLQPPLQGVVLQTYGNGNIPSNRKDLLLELKKASECGVLIVNISQCSKGCVAMDYETGRVLTEFGVLNGFNMTPEAALTKLSYVLAKDWSTETKRKMMEKNLSGELTCNTSNSYEDYEYFSTLENTFHLSVPRELASLKEFLFPSLMCAAAKAGDIEQMELLQQYGGDVKLCNYDCRTPLHVAANEGRFEMVEYLLERAANVHARDRNEQTPLMDAVVRNHFGIINLLRVAGAYLQKDSCLIGEKLCSAAASGDKLTLESYFLAGASLDQPDFTGRTALQVAVLNKKIDCVRFLIQNSADPNREDKLGNSALNIAKRIYGNDDVIWST